MLPHGTHRARKQEGNIGKKISVKESFKTEAGQQSQKCHTRPNYISEFSPKTAQRGHVYQKTRIPKRVDYVLVHLCTTMCITDGRIGTYMYHDVYY